VKPGDLVRPLGTCAGWPGSRKCEAAIITRIETITLHTQIDTHAYKDVEFDEYEILCTCGTLLTTDIGLELINGSR